MDYPYKNSTFLFPNENNNEWIDKYNTLVLDVKAGRYDFGDTKLSLHHIIPRSIAPELTKDKANFVYVPIVEHMMLHYYLWKADSSYGRQLWFGCVWCRKNKLWDLPGGDTEYEELKKSLKRK